METGPHNGQRRKKNMKEEIRNQIRKNTEAMENATKEERERLSKENVDLYLKGRALEETAEPITELEKQMIIQIVYEYDEVGINNTEFHNMTWDKDTATVKRWRGVFSSLKKKGIVEHYDDKGCFNPIFPTKKLVAICKQNNIEISEKAMQEINEYIN